MKLYFFKIEHTYTHKNKLYEALYNKVSSLDGMLIEGSDNLKRFKTRLEHSVDSLNSSHKRCKPISLHSTCFSGTPENNDHSLFVPGSWTARVYVVKQKFKI